jgi:four helix bundle protein
VRERIWKVQDFRNLQVWDKAHKLTMEIYGNTSCFPKDELFGLRSQMRRAASSMGANIAEGCGRVGDAELVRFLVIATGSASELEYHLRLARDLGFVPPVIYSDLDMRTREVKRRLAPFVQNLRVTGKAKHFKTRD